MSHLDVDWRRRIGDLVVAEGDALLRELVEVAHDHDLWDAMLPIVGAMSEPSRRRLAALPELGRDEMLAPGRAHGRRPRPVARAAAPGRGSWGRTRARRRRGW